MRALSAELQHGQERLESALLLGYLSNWEGPVQGHARRPCLPFSGMVPRYNRAWSLFYPHEAGSRGERISLLLLLDPLCLFIHQFNQTFSSQQLTTALDPWIALMVELSERFRVPPDCPCETVDNILWNRRTPSIQRTRPLESALPALIATIKTELVALQTQLKHSAERTKTRQEQQKEEQRQSFANEQQQNMQKFMEQQQQRQQRFEQQQDEQMEKLREKQHTERITSDMQLQQQQQTFLAEQATAQQTFRREMIIEQERIAEQLAKEQADRDEAFRQKLQDEWAAKQQERDRVQAERQEAFRQGMQREWLEKQQELAQEQAERHEKFRAKLQQEQTERHEAFRKQLQQERIADLAAARKQAADDAQTAANEANEAAKFGFSTHTRWTTSMAILGTVAVVVALIVAGFEFNKSGE